MENVDQIAKRYGVSRQAVYAWLKRGLPHQRIKRIGRMAYTIIDPKDVELFFKLGKQ